MYNNLYNRYNNAHNGGNTDGRINFSSIANSPVRGACVMLKCEGLVYFENQYVKSWMLPGIEH